MNAKNNIASRLYRITAPEGEGLHIFPSKWHIVESHLFIPFVHWFPKNWLRKIYIYVFTIFSREPNWAELEGRSVIDKTLVYYTYSIKKTYYRGLSTFKEIFTNQNFEVNFLTIGYLTGYEKLKKMLVVERLSNNKLLRRLVDWILINFNVVVLQTIKKG